MEPLSLLQNFDNMRGALLFLGLIPFILLYLIKPKPSERVIPSLMFLVRQIQQTKSNSFLKRFMRDILVLIHLFILFIISVAAMHPFYETDSVSNSEYTVLVLDNSASMQTERGFSMRLNDMLSNAKEHLDGKIGIILAQNSPYVVLQDGDKADAIDVINSIHETDMLTSLGSSILAADDLLDENTGNVVVISDFIYTDPLSPYIAKKSLEVKGHTVELINVNTDANNVGIVDMQSSDKETTITVQNYMDDEVTVDITVNSDDYTLTIAPFWREKLTFANKEGLNTIVLDYNDDFSLDNTIYLSIPARKDSSLLVLTNDPTNYVYPVLEAYTETWNPDAHVEKAEPPVMPVINHNIIVVSNVNENDFPSSSVRKIKERVENGATLIVTAQENLVDLGLNNLLPVNVGSLVKQDTGVYTENVLTAVTTDINIPDIEQFFQVTPKEGATVFASTGSGVPIMVIWSYGEGQVVYDGIFDVESAFRYDMSYPLFWLQLIDYAIGKDSIDSLNYRIGDKIMFDNEIKIITPSGKEIKKDYLEFEEVGVYSFMNKKVASNLFNAVESNVAFSDDTFERTLIEETEKTKIGKESVTKPVIIAIIVLFFLELLYVKLRGDF